jgi:putative membrane protein
MTYHKDKIVSSAIVILHLVGAIGSAMPQTRDFVVSLTPINLLITAGLLAYCHEASTRKLISFLTGSFLIGYFIEVVGVATGFPFGEYGYGNTLGFKVLNVPLLIGLNWFILSYSFGMLTAELRTSILVKAVIGALGMVALDYFIEPIAIRFDYWSWTESTIPLTNYIGWFVIAFLIQLIFHSLFNKNFNRQSSTTIASQTFYFIFLQIFFKI